MITIQREAKSRLSVDVVSAVDPSAATVQFAFPLRGARPVTWVAGTWFAAAVQTSSGWVREAITPRIGDPTLDLDPGHYRIFGRLLLGADEDVWEVDEQGLEVQ
jgi:hypothetical protein